MLQNWDDLFLDILTRKVYFCKNLIIFVEIRVRFNNDHIDRIEQMISGVGWLVKDGRNFVSGSLKYEDMSVQNTGKDFAKVISARTAIGHTISGELVIVVVDGKTRDHGVALLDFAEILIELGIYNAINLDGGGSSEAVVLGHVVNYPSDLCADSKLFACERPVATIACIHDMNILPDSNEKIFINTNIEHPSDDSFLNHFSSYRTLIIVLAVFLALSCFISLAACLMFFSAIGMLPYCSWLQWILENRNKKQALGNEEEYVPFNFELPEDDMLPSISTSAKTGLELLMQTDRHSDSDDELELTGNFFKPVATLLPKLQTSVPPGISAATSDSAHQINLTLLNPPVAEFNQENLFHEFEFGNEFESIEDELAKASY